MTHLLLVCVCVCVCVCTFRTVTGPPVYRSLCTCVHVRYLTIHVHVCVKNVWSCYFLLHLIFVVIAHWSKLNMVEKKIKCLIFVVAGYSWKLFNDKNFPIYMYSVHMYISWPVGYMSVHLCTETYVHVYMYVYM